MTRAPGMRALRLALICVPLLLSAGCRRLVRDGRAVPQDRPAATAVPERTPSLGVGIDQAAPAAGERATPPPGERVTIESGFAAVVDRVAGAVVNISSTRVIHPPAPEQMPFFDDPLFREFFGHGPQQMPRERRERALGSGVLVSADGLVLTNVHVVQGSSDIRVFLPDKRELKAQIVGQDPKTDVALLRIPGGGFPFLQLGDSSKVRVGDFVLAIGDPLGLGQTVTMGIISAKGRGQLGIVDYEDFIQTDAAINPGNSGGALIDVSGQLIGLNTAIATSGPGRGNQGIGFAVPANLVREVMGQIEQHGRVIRGWMGVAVQDVTQSMATALGLPSAGGALVGDVTPGGPAAQAGLQRGDVVVELDGKPVSDSRDLRLRVSEDGPGKRVTLVVIRGGARRNVTVNLGEMPSEEQKPGAPAPSPTGAMGIELAPLTPDLAHRLNVQEGTNGVVVTGVQPGSRAAEAGLRPGDILQEIDRTPVRSPDDVRKAVAKDGKRSHLALVLRDGLTHYVAIPPEGE